jgi:Spermine/spermidine synthase domain/Spermidine synthase tetramerisation domain
METEQQAKSSPASSTADTSSSLQQPYPAGIEVQRAKAGLYFREDMAPGLVLEMTLQHIYHTSESEFQDISVIETYFGRTLVTDGKTQSTQFDEFAYHESLVHPAMLNFASRNNSDDDVNSTSSGPKTVFIGGGGELATAREVLRHPSVERCVMVDLDGTSVCVRLFFCHVNTMRFPPFVAFLILAFLGLALSVPV